MAIGTEPCVQKIPPSKKKIKPKTRPQTTEEKEVDKEEENKEVEVGRRPRRNSAPQDSNKPKNFAGKRVRKKFGEDFYVGNVVNYEKPYFHVPYEDGDEEEMNLNVVIRWIALLDPFALHAPFHHLWPVVFGLMEKDVL